MQRPGALEEQRRRAIAWLGSRRLLHPANGPKRRQSPLSHAELQLLSLRGVLR